MNDDVQGIGRFEYILEDLNNLTIDEIQSRIDELEEFFDGMPEAEGREADFPEFQMLTTLQDRLSVIDGSLIRDLVSKARDSGDWTPVEQADVSEVQDMSNLFNGINGIVNLDLSGWDTSNVTNMERMFANSDINHPSVGLLNTSNVEDMRSMFRESKYNHPLHFDTSNVTDMSWMFVSSRYNHPLHFDISKVKAISRMFSSSKMNYPLDSFTFESVQCTDEIFIDSVYTWPIKNIDTLSREIGKEYDDLAELDQRNRSFRRFLETGECDDVSALMDAFDDNEEALIMIKQAHLKHSGAATEEDVVSTPSLAEQTCLKCRI